MKYFYLIALIWIVSACKTSNENTDTNNADANTGNYHVITFSDEDVPIRIPLTGHKYAFEEIFQPESILSVDGLLVVGDRYQKSMIHLIDINNNRYIRKYGQFGEGPGEIVSVSDFLPGHSPGSFWAYSINGKRLSEFNVKGYKCFGGSSNPAGG